MRLLSLCSLWLLCSLFLLACTAPEPTLDIPATVQAQVETYIAAKPTATPVPTHTPYPTQTDSPTSTPYPTATPRPTYVPLPTLAPRPTHTPYPTSTPYPTPTERPAPTPRPTYTPYPTATPFPTPAIRKSEDRPPKDSDSYYDLGFGQLLVLTRDDGDGVGLFVPRPGTNIILGDRAKEWGVYGDGAVLYVRLKCEIFLHEEDTGNKNSFGDGCFIVE